MVQISSVPIREARVYPCPDFKLSDSQMRNYKSGIQGIIAVLLCLAVGGSVCFLKLESPPIPV